MKDKLIRDFIDKQLSIWPMAKDNFSFLSKAEYKELEINGLKIKLQNNPARSISSAAKLDIHSIKGRKCFLCKANRPDNQTAIIFNGEENREYEILINPYPIFDPHLVIASTEHTAQSINNKYIDILNLSKEYTDFTFFYNGPHSGASAPDHLHFQACHRLTMPLEIELDKALDNNDIDLVYSLNKNSHIYHYKGFTRGIFVLRANTIDESNSLFYRLLEALPLKEGMSEPMLNLITWTKLLEDKTYQYRSLIIARESHRSHHFYSKGEDHLMMSPGCADMGGMFVVPNREDFEKINKNLLEEMLFEISINQEDEKKTIYNLEQMLLQQDELAGEVL